MMQAALPTSRAGRLWLIYAIAAATFLPALFFHYVGEEAIFPISSLEMWHRGEWLQQYLYGQRTQHNPLYNWLIIPLASLYGWEQMLIVARALTVSATVLTGLVAAWLANALFRDGALAAFVALVYLTLADVFFYRGWLAYADPLFALFLFGSAAALWIACIRQQRGLLALALAALTAAFMTKALTAYFYYCATALVLLVSDRRYRTFLLSPASWVMHAVAVAFPLAWFGAVPGNTGQGSRMLAEILAKLAPGDLGDYLVKLVAYPTEAFVRLAPLALVATYYAWQRGVRAPDSESKHTLTALWIAVVNFLPYWLAPHSATRYLMPIYPFVALVIGRFLWVCGERAVRMSERWLWAVIALKLVVVIALFPVYQSRYRGENYQIAAKEIAGRTAGQVLYTANDSASGLSVTAHLDVLRLPAPPLAFPPGKWESGFVVAHSADPLLGRTVSHYRLGGNDLYLLCRGAACEGKP